jgi:hypothetical protein
VSRPAAAIAAGLAALIGYVLRPILLAADKLPGIDAHNLFAWETYTRSVFRSGRLPFWNPYFFAGTPHLAEVEAQVLYPVALVLRWLPIPTYLSVLVAVHLWIAGVGAMVLARIAGTGWIAAGAAAIAVALGGSMAPWTHDGHLLLLESAAWLPWIFAFALLSVQRARVMPCAGLVAACGLQFLTGYLQGTLYTAAALTAFYGFTVMWPARATRRQVLLQWSITGVLAAGLVAFQLLPTALLAREAGRTGRLPWDAAAEGGWRAADLVRIVRPFAGFPAGSSYRELGDAAIYVGVLLVLVAPLAFAAADKRRVATFCALLGLSSLALASSAWLPFYRLHYALFPGLRIPGRVLFLTTFSLAVLGALGLDELLRLIRQRSLVAARVAGAVALAVVASELVAFAAPAIEPVSISTASPKVVAAAARSGGRVVSLCEHRVSAGEMLIARRPSLDGVPGMHLGRYADWAGMAHFALPPPRDGMYRRVNSDGDVPARRDLIDAANVGTVLMCGTGDVDGLELVDGDGVVDVYRNLAAWPRAIWTCAAEAGSPEDVRAQLLQAPLTRESWSGGGRTVRAGVGGEGSDLLAGTSPCASRAVVYVQAQDRPDGQLTLRFDAPSPGVLLVSEAFYPERRAYVDGRRVPAMKANVAFTAIPVPAGQHLVELRYVPVSFYAGTGISVMTITGWAALARRGRKQGGA